MNNISKNQGLKAFVFLITLCSLVGCQPTNLIPSSSAVTKMQREQLGDAMKEIILSDTANFDILPKDHPMYQSTYAYIQQLYNQAHFFMRDDWAAPADDKWNTSRSWEVFIIESEEKNAFCLPGGAFFVTTNLLKTLDLEYELYYVMSFEAVLMHERHILNTLIPYANNTAELLEIIENGVSSSNTTIEDLTDNFIQSVNYEDGNIVQLVDEKTHHRICESSLFDRLAILSLLVKLDQSDKWLTTRPSYGNRSAYVQNEINMSNSSDCGTIKWINNQTDYNTFVAYLP